MKNTIKLLALLLVAVMCLGVFAACGKKKEEVNTTPLVVGYAPFNEKFSPFFSETAYDQDVWAMTQISLLTSDRTGAVIEKGIKGTTVAYNGTDYTYYGPADLTITENADGTVYYDFVLRDDIVFSDGEKVTIDDVPVDENTPVLNALRRAAPDAATLYAVYRGERLADFLDERELIHKALYNPAANIGDIKYSPVA